MQQPHVRSWMKKCLQLLLRKKSDELLMDLKTCFLRNPLTNCSSLNKTFSFTRVVKDNADAAALLGVDGRRF